MKGIRKERFAAGRTAAVLLGALLAVSAAVPAGGAEPMSLGLARAIELALENDEALRQVGEAVVGAESQVTEARANAFPQLSLSGQYGRNLLRQSFFLPGEFLGEGPGSIKIEIGEDNDFTGVASVSQILWAAGRVSAGLEAAREYLSVFRYQETAAADYVRFKVKESYYSALLADEVLRISEKAFEAAEEAARIARAGNAQGMVSKFDLMRSEVELSNRRAPLVQARNDRDQALMALRRRCGLDPAQEMRLADSLGAASRPAGLDTMIAAMRAGSAEIKALEHSIGAQKQFLRIAKANRYPMLSLNAYYSVQTQWSDDWLPPSELIAKSAAVQVGLQIPIFDGFSSKGKIGKAKAELRSAELELERASRDRELAVRQAYLSLENALASLEGREESVRLAEEAHRLAIVRLTNGLATPIERLDAELAMTTSRAQLAEALFASSMAEAALELAVGNESYKNIMGSK